MRQILILLALLALGSVVDGSADDTVFAEMKDSRVFMQTRILPEAAFSAPSIESVAQRFLSEASTPRVISRLSMYDRKEIAVAEKGGACEGSYLLWRSYFDRFPKRHLVTADVMSVRENAVLRLRAADGGVARRVLRGSDPTQMLVDGVSFEILFVTGRVRSRFEGCGVPGTIDPIIFLKTASVLNLNLCQRVTSMLAAMLGVENVSAEFRNDVWFLCSPFPILFPFSPAEKPPSEGSYYSSPEYACGISCDGVARCIGPALTSPPRRSGGGR